MVTKWRSVSRVSCDPRIFMNLKGEKIL